MRLSRVLELSQHGNWIVNISYFCFPRVFPVTMVSDNLLPNEEMSSHVEVYSVENQTHHNILNQVSLGLGPVPVETDGDHIVQIRCRVLR